MREAKVIYKLLSLSFLCVFLISTSVSYAAPPPKVTISADKNFVAPGGTATLTWSSTNATTASIEPDIGTVDLNGSMPVTLSVTTTYTITVLSAKTTATDSVTVTVAQGNSPPVANNDSVSTNADTSVIINVVANDTDADGDTLFLESFTQPPNGIVVDNGDETVTYTPNSNFTESDLFTYTVSDGNGGSDSAQVTITISPAAAVDLIPPVNVASSFQADNNFLITWTAPENSQVTGYQVFKSTTSGQYDQSLADITDTQFQDNDVVAGTIYYYTIKSRDDSGNLSQSSVETKAQFHETFIDSISNTHFVSDVKTGDINGDGLQDVIIGAHLATNKGKACGMVYVYFKGNYGSKPDIQLAGENAGDGFGFSVAAVDLDNDGFDELVIGAPFYDADITGYPITGTAGEAGKIYIYKGASNVSSTPVYTSHGGFAISCNGNGYYSSVSERYGYALEPVGDVNGDGYNDLAVGIPYGGNGRKGEVLVFYGGNSIPASSRILRGLACDDEMGTVLFKAGDVNNDGYDDFLAGAYNDYTGKKAHLILGGPGNQLTISETVFKPYVQGNGLQGTGADINGDGYNDVIIGSGNTLYVHLGGQTLSSVADTELACRTFRFK